MTWVLLSEMDKAPAIRRAINTGDGATLARLGILDAKKVPYGSQREQWSVLVDNDAKSLQAEYIASLKTSGNRHKRPLSEKHINDLNNYLNDFWAILGGVASLDRLTRENMETVLNSFVIKYDEKRDFFSTKRHIYHAVTGFSQWAGVKTSFTGLRPKKIFKFKRDFLEPHEITAALTKNRLWTIGRSPYSIELLNVLIAIYGYAGLRREEAISLRLDQVHLDKNYLHVYGKNYKERLVPIFPELRPHLENWLEMRRDSEFFLSGKRGKAIPLNTVAYVFHGFRKKTGMKITPHCLRRACATIAANNGMPNKLIQLMLGHEKWETTEIYIRTDERHLLQWVERYGAGQLAKPPKEAPQYAYAPLRM